MCNLRSGKNPVRKLNAVSSKKKKGVWVINPLEEKLSIVIFLVSESNPDNKSKPRCLLNIERW